ncbi:MFS transporter [uncultured Streptomyces sp.]|uniref:MFS transporter n=1 Tax=uncultured Streptomyces sp. TaxID=174707 RepID=UPI00261CC646|nr:MFS transporter [uncultured Streptomyces sp.]
MTPAPPSRPPIVPATPSTRGRRVSLSPDPVVRALAALLVVNATGNGLFLTISTLWFTHGLGYSAPQVGFALTLAGLCGVLAAIPAGRASDRHGAKRVLAALHLVQAAAMVGYAVADTYTAFLLLACGVTAGSRANAAVRSALYAHSLPAATRAPALGLLRAVNNVGIGAGAALGAAVVALDRPGAFQAAILADAATFVLALIPLRKVPATQATPARVHTGHPKAASALRDGPYLLVTGLNAIVNTLYVVLEVALPLWLVNHTRAPRTLVGALLILNTLLVVVLQIRAAHRATTLPAAIRSFRLGGILTALACVTAAAAPHRSPTAATVILLTAVVLLTLGEVTSQAGSWTLGYALAPDHAQGDYQGVFQTGISLTQALGPILITTLVLPHGAIGWIALGAVFCAAALALPPAARRAEQAETARFG